MDNKEDTKEAYEPPAITWEKEIEVLASGCGKGVSESDFDCDPTYGGVTAS